MKTKTPDAGLAPIREVRHQISEQVDHDPKRLVRYYQELQRQYRGRLIEADHDEPRPAPVG